MYLHLTHTHTVWGISESHLTTEGIQRFRQELKFQSQAWKYVPGAPAPPLTAAPGCIGGKASGVGVLTNSPARPLPNDWSSEVWSSARLQTCAIRIQSHMGLPNRPIQEPHVRQQTSSWNMSQRRSYSKAGLRIICGNLNQDDPESLEQFTVWRFNGFVEIQNLAAQKSGYPIRPTCHQKTKKDQMWLSPELAPRLANVYIDDTVFPDHATVVGEFMELAASPPVPI